MIHRNGYISAALAVLTVLWLFGCGGPQEDSTRPSAPASLGEALKLIIEDDARDAQADKDGSALPAKQRGDDVWLAGPASTVSINTGAHILTLTSGSSQLGDPDYLSYGIFKFTDNLGETAQSFSMTIPPDPTAEYTVYCVEYAGPPSWVNLGTFTGDPGNNGVPLDLPYMAVSPAGNVYVAVVVANLKSLVLASVRVADYFEEEDNDSTASATLLPFTANGFGATVNGQIGIGDPIEDYDGDNEDWFVFTTPDPIQTVLFNFDYTNSTGQVDAYLYSFDGVSVLDQGAVVYGDEYIVETLAPGQTYYLRLSCTSGYAYYTITMWDDDAAYFEVEDNDGSAEATPFTVASEIGPFSAEVGSAGGNDGDTVDWFGFNGLPGLSAFRFYADDKTAGLDIELIAADGSTVLNTAQEHNEVFVLEQFTNNAQFYIRVNSPTDTSAYVFAGNSFALSGQGSLDEMEPNDIPLGSNQLPAFPFSNWTGSLGAKPGGSNYDGDRVDYGYFSASGSGSLQLTLTYDFDDSDAALYLYDQALTEVASSDTTGSVETLNYFVPGAGNYYVEIRGKYAATDYELDGTFTP